MCDVLSKGWGGDSYSIEQSVQDVKFSAQREFITPEGQAGMVAASRVGKVREQAAAGVFCTSGFLGRKKDGSVLE